MNCLLVYKANFFHFCIPVKFCLILELGQQLKGLFK